MKKILAIMLAVMMVLALAACGGDSETTTAGTTSGNETTAPADNTTAPEDTTAAPEDTTGAPEVTVMTHAEYMAAEMEAPVVVETYVQATQSWWDNQITAYCQSPDGAYLAYNMACAEEDAAKLTAGTKIRITGFKGEWSGQVEIVDATFEIIEGDTWTATATDVTSLLGTEELINHQTELVAFNGLTIEKVEYKNGEPGYGNDIYVTVSYNGASYDFCVEAYLTDPDTDVYKTVGALTAGTVVNVEGFAYWYNGINTHITSVTVVE